MHTLVCVVNLVPYDQSGKGTETSHIRIVHLIENNAFDLKAPSGVEGQKVIAIV